MTKPPATATNRNEDTMSNASLFWDSIADRYSRSPIKDPDAYEATLERTRSYLHANDRVLELGCGTGSTALLLAEQLAQFTASDFSAGMIDVARAKIADGSAPNVRFTEAGVGSDMLSGEAARIGGFDVVMAFNLLHLLKEPAAELDRVRSLVKPGGLFISKTPCLGDRSPLLRPLIAVMQLFGKAPHVTYFGVDELDRLMERSGFKLVETGLYPANQKSRFIVAERLDG
ncbi:MAG: class I SAM-dependent methyltransferase [Pseudomonadota bacterium]